MGGEAGVEREGGHVGEADRGGGDSGGGGLGVSEVGAKKEVRGPVDKVARPS